MKIFNAPYKPARISEGKIKWYVYYHYQYPPSHPKYPGWKQFKDRGGLNYIDDTRERKEAAEMLRDAYNERLKSGWSPFGAQPADMPEYDNMKFMPAVEVLKKLLYIKQNSIKKRTWQSYKYSLDVFINWANKSNLQHTAIEFIRPVTMTQFFDHLRTNGGYKNKSINNHAANIGVLFNAAVERELCVKNPLKGYKKLPEEKGKNYPFTPKQKADLKKRILKDDPDLWLYVKCIYHLFVRPIELLQIKISDIDLRTKQIIIHSSTGKNKRQLPVEIPDSFMKEVKALKLENYPADYYLFGYDLKICDKPYNRNSITERHTAILRACGITDSNYTMYGWKHTGNVDSYLAGIDIYDLMRQNRHHSLEQTMNYLRSMGLRPNVNFRKKGPKL